MSADDVLQGSTIKCVRCDHVQRDLGFDLLAKELREAEATNRALRKAIEEARDAFATAAACPSVVDREAHKRRGRDVLIRASEGDQS